MVLSLGTLHSVTLRYIAARKQRSNGHRPYRLAREKGRRRRCIIVLEESIIYNMQACHTQCVPLFLSQKVNILMIQPKDVVVPPGMEAFYERFHFAPAIKDGDRLFCSGQLGNDSANQLATEPEVQFAQAFANVKAVLEAAGAAFADVVEMTTFHVGLQTHLRTFMQVKDRYLQAPYPAWTAIGVSELAFPGALVEIKVTARLRA